MKHTKANGLATPAVPVVDERTSLPMDAPRTAAGGAGGDAGEVLASLFDLEQISLEDLTSSVPKARRHCGLSDERLRVLDGYSELLAGKLPAESDFVTITRRPSRMLDRRGAPVVRWGTPKAAFRDVHRLFRDCDVQTPSFWVCEPHRWHDELHVHGLVRRLNPGENQRLFLTSLHRFGRTSIRPANAGAVPYVCKYLFKDACCGRHDYLDFSGLKPADE